MSSARWGAVAAWVFVVLLNWKSRGQLGVPLVGFSWFRVVLTSSFILGCVTYFLWARGSSGRGESVGRAFSAHEYLAAVRPGWPILLAAVCCVPISTDPNLYLQYGAMALDGINPYIVKSKEADTAFTHGLLWNQTCAYGPIALASFSLAALFRSLAVGLVVFKLLWTAAYLYAGYLFARAGSRARAERARLFVFHPVLLLAFVADLHVDVLVVLALLAAFGAVAAERSARAALFLVSACMVKAIAIPAAAFWAAWCIAQRRHVRAATCTLAAIGVAFGLSLTLLPTGAAWRSLINPVPNTARSIQHMLITGGPRVGFDGARIAHAYSVVASLLFVAAVLWLWVRAVRNRSYDAAALVADFALVMLLACLFVFPYVPWWYCTIVIVAASWTSQAAWLRMPAAVYAVGSSFTLTAGIATTTWGLLAAVMAILPTILVLIAARWGSRRLSVARRDDLGVAE